LAALLHIGNNKMSLSFSVSLIISQPVWTSNVVRNFQLQSCVMTHEANDGVVYAILAYGLCRGVV